MREQAKVPRLAKVGDKTERDHWGHMRTLIPHYETFWQLFVYHLRSDGSIWFRDGVDSSLEGIAIASYSTFAALARARHKIFVDNEQYRHVEELYAAIQRSAEIGVKLMQQFAAFYAALASRSPAFSAEPLQGFIDDRLKRYRNLLHDAIMAMPKDSRGRRLVPLPDSIDEYRSWTKTMYSFRPECFVVAADQLKSDFRATCSRLEENWKMMSAAHQDLVVLPAFQAALSKGRHVPQLMAAPPASGAFFLGASSAGGQPTSGAFAFPGTKPRTM